MPRPVSNLFLVLAALAGCSREPADAPRAREAVAARFGYPSSVEFRQVRAGAFPRQVCGEARGRTIEGEMTDFRRFNWQPDSLAIEGFEVANIPGNDSFNAAFARLNDLNVSTGCKH